MATAYEARERKDDNLINEVLEKASIAQEKMPDKVFIGTDEKGYRIVRIKDDGTGVRENKLHAPGTCLNPE